MANDQTIQLDNVRIAFRNFAGKEGQYNREGDRNFSIVLDDDTAERLKADGWNVKSKEPREDGDGWFHHLPVSVSYKGRIPPRIVMLTSKNRTVLDEDMCELIDWAEIESVDVIVRPYDWAVSGKTGRKAYLKTIYVTIVEDPLDMRYEHLPMAGQTPALQPSTETRPDSVDYDAEPEY